MEAFMKRTVVTCLCIFLTAFSLAVFSPFAIASDTIKVGIIDSYSGPASPFTNAVLDGFKMAVNKINAKGGVLGKKIEVTTRDDKFKPDIALASAKELIMKEKVDLLVGTINSGSALSIADLVKKEKIPFIATYSKTDKLTGEKGNRYTFSMNENTTMAGRAAAVALAKKPYVKYWIAGDDYEYGHAIAESVWNNLKALKPNAQLLGQTWWKVGEADFTPYITSILAAKPDFVIVATGGSGMVNFLKSAKATGFAQKAPFYQHTAGEALIMASLGMDAPEGVYGTNNYLFYYPDTPDNKAFVEEYKKAYNKFPPTAALYGYMTAQFIAKAYEKAGKVDTEKFVDAFEGMVLDSPVGKMEMRKCDHQVIVPMYWGVTKKSPDHNFLIVSDIITIPGKDYVPTCAEVQKLRK
jgi:branched-chain amino acid transport system substrate-binding protein